MREATLIPLDTWRAALGLHPWHFWQLADTSVVPVQSKCSTLVYEYDWQGSDAAGRVSIRRAIVDAEEMLTRYLGYAPAPRYTEWTVNWPRFSDAGQWRYRDIGADGRRVAVTLPEGMVQALGVISRSLLGTAGVVLTDADGDGLTETFTLTLTVAVDTDPASVRIYFSETDRWDDPTLDEGWRVEPVAATLNGTLLTITGRSWLIVRPVLYEQASGRPLDPGDEAVYAATLDIYTVSTNGNGEAFSDAQATLLWETKPCGSWGWCCNWSTSPTSSIYDPGATGYAVARAGIRDSDLGLVTPAQAVRDATTGVWMESCCTGWTEPDRVTVRALAGAALVNGQMDPAMRAIMVRLATAEAKRRICACRETNEEIHSLQQDLTLESTQTERYTVAPEDLSNPFGTRRGHVQAWRMAKDRIIRRGIAA
jgi:hypothetical protein